MITVVYQSQKYIQLMAFPSLTVGVSLYFGFSHYNSQVCSYIVIDSDQHFSLPNPLLDLFLNIFYLIRPDTTWLQILNSEP